MEGEVFPFPRQFWAQGQLHPGLSSLHPTSCPCSSTAVMLWLGKWELTGQRKGWGWEGTSQDTFPGCALGRDIQQGSALGSPPRINAREIDCYKVCALPLHPSGREKGVPAFCGPRKKKEHKGSSGAGQDTDKKMGQSQL